MNLKIKTKNSAAQNSSLAQLASHFSVRLPVFVAVFMLVTACGQPRVKAPQSKKLNPPEFNNGGNFNLTSFDLKDTAFTGSMVVFNNRIQSETMTNLLRSSNEYNVARIARNESFSSFSRSEIEPRRNAISMKQSELDVLQAQGNAQVFKLRTEAAQSWLTTQVEALGKQIPGLNKNKTNNVVKYYCEAKLWDFALSPAVFEKSYKQRPTPAAVCEGIYAANVEARFFDDPSCAPNPAGQSYFDCIWKAGVKKTAYYQNSFLKTDTPTADSEGPLHEKFWALISDPVFEATITSKPPEGSDCDAGLRSRILQGSKPKATNNNNLCNGTKYDFTNKLAAGIAKNAAPESSSLQTIINAMEVRDAANRNTDITTADAYTDLMRLVPTKLDDGTAVSPEHLAAEYVVREKIRNFMTPFSGCSKAFRTPNDLLFNGLTTARALEESDQCPLPDLATVALPEILPQDSSIQNKKAEIDALLLDLGNTRGDACIPAKGCSGESNSHSACNWFRALEGKTASVNEVAGVEILVKDISLVPVRDETGSTSLQLILDKELAGHVCLGSASNPQAPCVENPLEKGTSLMTLNFDAAIGHLVISLKLSEKALAATARVPEGGFGKYVGKTLTLDLYSNNYNGKASYLSGKALIKEGETVIAQGQASYLMNEAEDKPVREFCAGVAK